MIARVNCLATDVALSRHWSFTMRAVAGIALMSSVLSVHAAGGAYGPDPDRGRALYEARCTQCHTPNIHSRLTRALTRDELRGIVDQMRRVSSLGWTPDEIEDVVEHLARTRYRLMPER